MYELPGRADVAKVVVEAASVIDKTPPTMVPRASVRSARPRRAAS
jgi:ATP-dependent Clp protease ATP-binding subunit ClpX